MTAKAAGRLSLTPSAAYQKRNNGRTLFRVETFTHMDGTC